MDMYTGLIYTIVYNHLSEVCSKEDIEECVSDIFLNFFNYRDKIDIDKASVKGFLCLIAKRKAIDVYRKASVISNTNIPLDDVEYIMSDDSNDVLLQFSKRERNKSILETIKSLGEPDSEILIRKYYLRQTTKDISKVLGIKPNTIDKKASRCVSKLRDMLGGGLL